MTVILLLLLSLVFSSSSFAEVPVSAPEAAPAARGRTQPEIAFSGDRYLAVWLDERDCTPYERGTLYGARFDRGGRQLDPHGFVIAPCGGDNGYGTPQVFAENGGGWTVTLPSHDRLTAIRIGSEGTIGLSRSVAIPLLFDPRTTRSDNGYLIYNSLGDNPAIVTDPELNILARHPMQRFGTSAVQASDGRDYVSVSRPPNRNTILADVIGGDGTLRRRDVVLVDNVMPAGLTVAWTGTDYLVAWSEGPMTARRLVALHLDRNANPTGAPEVVRENVGGFVSDLTLLPLRNGLALYEWTDRTKFPSTSFATIAGCELPVVPLRGRTTWATDGNALLGIRAEPLVERGESRRVDLFAHTAPIGCGALAPAEAQLVSAATIAQEYPAVAMNATSTAIAWIDVQTNALRGLRLNADGTVAGALRFPPHESPRDVSLATDGSGFFASWNDRGTVKAGRVVDAASAEQPVAYTLGRALVPYEPQSIRAHAATWSGSEYLVFIAASGIRVSRFSREGVALDPAPSRHRSVRFFGTPGEVVVPPQPGFFGYTSPRVAWTGSGEGLLVYQTGTPCGIIPECDPPRAHAVRIDDRGRAAGTPRRISEEFGLAPDVVWTGSEYVAVYVETTLLVRRVGRDGNPLGAPADTGIAPGQFSLSVLRNRPLIAASHDGVIEVAELDETLRGTRVAQFDASGSGRTFASIAAFGGRYVVAFHRAAHEEPYGGSTRVFYEQR